MGRPAAFLVLLLVIWLSIGLLLPSRQVKYPLRSNGDNLSGDRKIHLPDRTCPATAKTLKRETGFSAGITATVNPVS